MQSSALRAAIAAVSLLLPAALAAQGSPIGDPAFDSAYFAWQRGDYPDALRRLDRLMAPATAVRYLEPVALLTGELYNTIELTRDGRTPSWSPNGRFVAWESGAAAERRVHIAAIENGRARVVATVNGAGPRFDGAGRVVYAPAQAPDTRVARDPVSNQETPIAAGLNVLSFLSRPGSSDIYVLAASPRDASAPAQAPGGGRGGPAVPADVYQLSGSTPVKITSAAGAKSNPAFLTGDRIIYTIDNQSFAIQTGTSDVKTYQGTGVTVSGDGSTIAFMRQEEGMNIVTILGASGTVDAVRRREAISGLALSRDGRRLAYQATPREDWDIYVVDSDGKNEKRLTRDIAHDIMPRFIFNDRILAVTGEARHRRSFMYDVNTGKRTRLFHNNTVRTVAPEYEWYLSPDATKVLIVAERDGDTVSPERGIYVFDMSVAVTAEEVRARVRTQIAQENALRTRGRALFANIDAAVRAATSDVSKDRIYQYELDLYQFDSKYITQPGNAKAIEYLTNRLKEWGYEPEVQWFETTPRGTTTPVRTANVIAKLPGVMQPDVLYTVSSHFDSVERGPGADDDTSGTAALLEAARVLSKRPQPMTIHFAFFTGEEAGLLGSREYVRRAVERKDLLVGALNNDMIGFANDQRLDNTIRYSNAGIRDIQHAAAFLYTDLITYDAKYYKNTDANAYYDAYGDIVGGIGSYPILSNPHYHQTHDQIETMNHQLIAEVSKTTVATLMKLTNSPSRPKRLEIVARTGSTADITWEPLADKSLLQGGGYEVRVIGANGRIKGAPLTVPNSTTVRVSDVAAGDVIEVWGKGAKGMSWDAARVIVP